MDLALPQAADAERTIIGLIFKDNKLIWSVIKTLKDSDFYLDLHKKIISSMIVLADQDKPIDYVTIQNKLKTEYDQIVDKSTLSEFVEYLPLYPKLDEYINLVYLTSIERQKAKLHNAAQTAIMTGKDASLLQAQLEEVSVDRRRNNFNSVADNNDKLLEQFYEQGKLDTHITGLRTGYRKLDYFTSGLQKQDLILIAARPSQGKTSVALSMCENICEANPETVICFFSLEMSELALKKRLLSSMARIDAQKLKNGQLTIKEWARLLAAKRRLSKFKLFINDEAGLSVLQMKAKAKILQNEQNRIDLIIIDYLQLMGSDEKITNIEQETSRKVDGVKALAKDFDIPILLLSQLSRAPEGRNDHRPQLSDIRYSGSGEQTADVALLIYKEDKYEKTSDNEGLTELILSKQRNGPTGTIFLYFIKQYTRFEGISPANLKFTPH